MRRQKSPHAQFIALFSELFVPEDALVIFDELVASKDFIQQQQCMVKFLEFMEDPYIEDEDIPLMWNLIVVIYMACPPRHELQKTIERKFLKRVSEEDLTEYFSENIKKHMISVPEKNSYLLNYNYIRSLTTISELQSASAAIQSNIKCLFDFVFLFVSELLDIIYERKKKDRPLQSADWLVYIDDASKFLLHLVTKDRDNVISDEDKLKLIPYCYDTLVYPEVLFNIKRNCGYIMVKLISDLPEQHTVGCRNKQYPHFDLLQFDKKPGPFLERLGIKKVTDSKLIEVFKICVYTGILNISSPFNMLLENEVNGLSIVAHMFNEFGTVARGGYNKTDFVKAILRGLLTLSDLIFSIKEAPIYISKCLDLMIIYADIKDKLILSYVKQILTTLVAKARTISQYMQIIFSWVLSLPVITIRYLALITLCDVGGANFIIKEYPLLSRNLLDDVVCCSNPQMVTSCIVTLMTRHHTQIPFHYWMKYWVVPILNELKTKDHLPFAKHYQKLFVSAFKINPLAIKVLIQQNFFATDFELCTFLECIQLIKAEDLHVKSKYKETLQPIMRRVMSSTTVDTLITYKNDEARTRMLSIMANCAQSKKEFEQWECVMLEKFYYFNINTTCPGTRQDFISILKNIFVKLRESFIAAQETYKEDIDKISKIAAYYRQFRVGIMTDTLLAGLNHDCNHIRRSACLDIINYTSSLKDGNLFLELLNAKDVSNLKYIIQADTYEQNKILATRILILFPYQRLGLADTQIVTKHVKDALILAVNLTPTHSVSAALLLKLCIVAPDFRSIIIDKFKEIVHESDLPEYTENDSNSLLLLNYLMEQVKKSYVVAKDNLEKAASTQPIHGFILCIRYLLASEALSERSKEEKWKQLYVDIIEWCIRLSEIINTIICNQSPEGFLPEDFDISQTDETAKAQMLTVFGWRAAKEISLLFGDIASRAPIISDTNTEGLINENQLSDIGNYFFYLLIHTKHRGAFEQASIGFTKLCERLWSLPNSTLYTLPQSWIVKTLEIMEGSNKDTSEACATRRSAGVPFMVQAILITEPLLGNPLFCSTMETLLNVSSDTSKLEDQRIHALNILRALFKHTKLQRLVTPYCSRGMKIAIQGFRSTIWGIRNSCTLLFSSLMIRIFGVQITQDRDNLPFSYHYKMAAKVFLANYCDLYVFMFETLMKAQKDRNDPVLYPVLLLFSQLFCFNEASEPLRRKQLMQFVDTCLHNPSYRIRNIAAKVLIQLKEHHKLPQYVVGCLIRLSNPTISDSYCHGTLLQLQYLLDAAVSFKIKINVPKVIDGTGWILICCPRYTSHLTASAYIDILMRLIIKYDLKFENCKIFNLLTHILQHHLDLDSETILISVSSKKFRTLLFQLKLYLSLHAKRCTSCDNNWNNIYSKHDIFEKDLKNHQFLQNVCLRYMHYIKLLSSEFDRYVEYEEFQTLYMQPIIQLLALINIDFKKHIYGVLYNSLTKFIIRRGPKMTCELVKSSFYEMLCFYDFSVFLKTRNYHNVNDLMLKHILNCCEVAEDRLAFQAITWLDSFILQLSEEDLKAVDLTPMFQLLHKLSLSCNDVLYRFGVSKFLVHNRRLFLRKDWLLNAKNLGTVWMVVFILFEDDDEGIRKIMAELVQADLKRQQNYFYVPESRVHIPECARRSLLHELITMMPVQCTLSFLLSLALRSKQVNTENMSLVFDEVDVNTNIELFPVAKEAIKVLSRVFLDIKGGLETATITESIDDPTLLTTIILLVKFYQNDVPFISPKLNESMCNITIGILAFLSTDDPSTLNFAERFKRMLSSASLIEPTPQLNVSEKHRARVLLSNIFKYALK